MGIALCPARHAWHDKQFPRSGHSLVYPRVYERKVRTSQGRIPRENGGGLLEGKFTASATENKPLPLGSKGEKVG
jgi:hypothetical protein